MGGLRTNRAQIFKISVKEPSFASSDLKYDVSPLTMRNMTETMLSTVQLSPIIAKCSSSTVIGAVDGEAFRVNAR